MEKLATKVTCGLPLSGGLCPTGIPPHVTILHGMTTWSAAVEHLGRVVEKLPGIIKTDLSAVLEEKAVKAGAVTPDQVGAFVHDCWSCLCACMQLQTAIADTPHAKYRGQVLDASLESPTHPSVRKRKKGLE